MAQLKKKFTVRFKVFEGRSYWNEENVQRVSLHIPFKRDETKPYVGDIAHVFGQIYAQILQYKDRATFFGRPDKTVISISRDTVCLCEPSVLEELVHLILLSDQTCGGKLFWEISLNCSDDVLFFFDRLHQMRSHGSVGVAKWVLGNPPKNVRLHMNLPRVFKSKAMSEPEVKRLAMHVRFVTKHIALTHTESESFFVHPNIAALVYEFGWHNFQCDYVVPKLPNDLVSHTEKPGYKELEARVTQYFVGVEKLLDSHATIFCAEKFRPYVLQELQRGERKLPPAYEFREYKIAARFAGMDPDDESLRRL